MLKIIMFAMLGAKFGMNYFYWIAFGLFCLAEVLEAIVENLD